MEIVKKIKSKSAILFDMDGTLLDSNVLKVRAMDDALDSLPNKLQFVKHFAANFGLTRAKHFEFLARNFLNNDIESADIYRKRYESYLHRNRGCQHLCEGTIELLDFFVQIAKPLFVVTGSDHREAEHLLASSDLKQYFKEVLGSPMEKSVQIKRIMEKYNWSSPEVLVIGDSLNDLYAAVENKVDFLFCEQYSLSNKKEMQKMLAKYNFQKVPNLFELYRELLLGFLD